MISKESNLQDSIRDRHKTIVETLEHSPIVYIHICTVVFSLVTEYEMKFVYAGDYLSLIGFDKEIQTGDETSLLII